MENLKGVTKEAKSLIQYQEDSVVSREILKDPSGSVTLFAFDRGQGLSEHTAPFDAMVYLLEGKASVRIEKRTLSVREGEFVIMPADKPHALMAEERFKMLLIMLKSSS